MNKHADNFLAGPATTTAADGMRRRAWTIADIEAMQEAGIIGQGERFELIGGEVVPMQAKGGRHEIVKLELNFHFQQSVSKAFWVAPETTLRLDEITFLEPDFCVFPRKIFPSDMRGYDVLLAIEVSDSSLAYDLGRKIGIYAAFGIPEIWVINANTLGTHVFRKLGAEGYADVLEISSGDEIISTRVPELKMQLAALGLTPLSD